MNTPEVENNPLPVVPPKLMLFSLAALSFLGAMLGSGLVYFVCESQGIDMKEAFREFGQESPLPWRNFMRGILLLNHLTSFLLPALFVGWIFYRKRWSHLFNLHAMPHPARLALGIFFMMAAFPLAQVALSANAWIVEKIEWLKPLIEMEGSSENLITGLLVMQSPWELVFSLIVMGLVPAIGEEMVFRGIIQNSLERWMRRPVAAILLTALLFSLIHFQIERLLAIFLLGVVLGLLFYWTKNLWVSIAAHFFNNAMQVFVAWFYQDKIAEFNKGEMQDIPWGLAVISLVIVVFIGIQLHRGMEKPESTQRV